MVHETHRDETISSQEQIDESYWDALLTEGEYSRSTPDDAPPEFTDPPRELIHETETSISGAAAIPNGSHWQRIAEIMENDGVLELKVVGYNRGGLLVEWETLRGFVPASQLIEFPATQREDQRRDALVERVGDLLQLRVIELDPEKNRLILSERAAQVAAGTRDQVLEALNSGDVVSGRVTNLCDFGAFVDLGGIEGLIHISELSWGRVAHPADVLRRDDYVEVYVLDVDPDNMRVALSVKRLYPDPWATVDERYEIGEVVEGRITNVVDFGAFACIEDGLEGLIHFSELAEGHFLHPRNVVQEGEIVKARILSIDGRARRLGLSLRLM